MRSPACNLCGNVSPCWVNVEKGVRGDVSRTFACRTSHDDLAAHKVGGDSHAAEERHGNNRPGALGSVASSLGLNSLTDLAEFLVDARHARHVIGNAVTKVGTEGEVTVDKGGSQARSRIGLRRTAGRRKCLLQGRVAVISRIALVVVVIFWGCGCGT